MIDKEDIEQAKRTDLAALVQAKGVHLKKNGKSLLGLCPFHADKTPSLSINTGKNLWQCFGCGAAGDAIRFVELFDQVDFKEAVKRLSDNGFKRTQAKPVKDNSEALSVKDKKLLARVVGFYQHSFEQDRRGLDYLTGERNINDLQSIKDFGTGFVNGTLTEILPHPLCQDSCHFQCQRLSTAPAVPGDQVPPRGGTWSPGTVGAGGGGGKFAACNP